MAGTGKATTLDAQIDELYGLPLSGFVEARQALARTLSGDTAKQVKALVKPTVVPWAANQIYWHARLAYDRVLKSGEKLRTAQVAALKGKKADVATLAADHRKAIAEAVRTSARFVPAGAPQPDREALARLLEAASLSPSPPEPHGRFTKPVVPAGFEALAGIDVKAPAVPKREAAARAAAVAIDEAERRRQQKLHDAQAALDQATAEERRALDAWSSAKEGVARARQALAKLQ